MGDGSIRSSSKISSTGTNSPPGIKVIVTMTIGESLDGSAKNTTTTNDNVLIRGPSDEKQFETMEAG